MADNALRFDVIICGQGIAGTTLAWTLLNRGARVMVIDRGDLFTASRIAAGLITPISGRRFTVAPGFDHLLKIAQQHYHTVGKATDQEFLFNQAALRFCMTPAEQEMFASRRDRLGQYVTAIDPPPAAGLATALEGFAMPHARRLIVSSYLNHSREFFSARGMFLQATLDPQTVQPHAEGMVVTAGQTPVEHLARHLVFCGGAADAQNSWLPEGVFNSAKGEILTVRIPDFTEQRTIHAAGCWLAPTRSAHVYRCGATYDHDDLTTATTKEAHERLTAHLRSFLDLPFTVVDQHAAIRPVGMGRMPVIGRHHRHPHIAWFNGLGSKGALWAPALAHTLAGYLLDGTVLDLDVVRPPGESATRTRHK